jgi:hypothetical protein
MGEFNEENIQHRTLNLQHPMPLRPRDQSVVGCSMLEVGCF